MARTTPILDHLQRTEPLLEQYGPPVPGHAPVLLVQTFGPIEAEYASVRRGCGLLDQPHRAVIRIGGGDRLAFLNRMLTQELKDLKPWQSRSSFWLSRKGRIDADLRVICLPDHILLDLDVHAAANTVKSLSEFVIADDVTIEDHTEQWHRLALHGPGAAAILEGVTLLAQADAITPAALAPQNVTIVRMGQVQMLVDRFDTAGVPGLELFVPVAHAAEFYTTMLQFGSHPPGAAALAGRPAHAVNFRPIGWAAWNMARIESGTPIYPIDFGHDSLPAETGALEQRVSFKKGCYLGQEVVARMHSLGHPKQTLCAIKFDDAGAGDESPPQPVTGAPLYPLAPGAMVPADASALGEPVGTVTSSTLSPMLGGAVICFAQLKWAHKAAGTRLTTVAEGRVIAGTVQAKLQTWPVAPSSS